MAQTSLSYYEKVLKSKVARVRLYPAQDAGAFGCQGAEDRNLLRLHRSCGPAAEKFTIGVVFMNILFFLSPKQDLMYVYDDFTLRQTLEKWEQPLRIHPGAQPQGRVCGNSDGRGHPLGAEKVPRPRP